MPHPLHVPARASLRRAAATTVVASVLGAGTLLASPAQAAWTSGALVHGGNVLVCKVPLDGGDLRVRVRLDNRKAEHTHIGLLYRYRGGKETYVKVRAAAGKQSATKSLRLTRGDVVGSGISEVGVGGLGGTMTRASIPRC
ncbi:hypothetical protein GHK92_19610 [Nocardioides sp. dk4132]|uniref:hypothetical protein n=1 Tax=unclassified Nocardioides TaxID=2615069 RepID=UPI0012962F27|nr:MULTISPECIES: hypothetical protein [unclassified Nocardioides]MQW78079.1 hypothetical protein [Nocardioides sp. dk4132]QGA08181.1 hypothetical protein GFH29_12785 [Nocardioides sp. dk884]